MVQPLDFLTRREHEVFWLVAERLRNREIAERLHVSERTVESHVASLLRKLGGPDRSSLIALGARLRQHVTGAVRLPRVLSSFVGRDGEVEQLRQLVLRDRLVTLIGPAGVGKTRLAFHVADLVPELAAPVLVDLATVPVDHSVEGEFASALGMANVEGSLRTSIVEAMRDGRHFLVIDNVEHVVEPTADLLRDLMTATDGLHVLATSRMPLGVAGEALMDVAPLDVPPMSENPAEVLAAASVRLFADRAVRAAPAFRVTSANAADVATLCRRLDGLPLALELAAARIRTFSAAELVAHLDDRFGLLAAGPESQPRRHSTLDDALRWSYELLDEDERVLFERLSVFPAAFDYDTACAVAAHDPVDPARFLRLFPRLLDRSLLAARRLPDHSTSYGMLETFRAFAQQRLAERGEHEEATRRHARHFIDRAIALAPDLHGRDQPAALQWFSAHQADLAAAMRHVLDKGDRDTAWSVIAGVGSWVTVGIRGDLFDWLDQLLSQPFPSDAAGIDARVAAAYLLVFNDTRRSVEIALEADRLVPPDDPAARARVDLVVGWTLSYLGDNERAIKHLSQAAEWFRRNHDTWHEAVALQGLGRANQDVEVTVEHLRSAAQRFGSLRDDVRAANCLTTMATRCLELNSHLDELEAWLDDARRLAQRSGNTQELLHVDLHLARLQQLQGAHDSAAIAYEHLLPALRRIGDHRCARRCLIGLGWAAMVNGDDTSAVEHLTAGVSLAQDMADPRETAAGLRMLAALAHRAGQGFEATRLEQAAEQAASRLDPMRRRALPTIGDLL